MSSRVRVDFEIRRRPKNDVRKDGAPPKAAAHHVSGATENSIVLLAQNQQNGQFDMLIFMATEHYNRQFQHAKNFSFDDSALAKQLNSRRRPKHHGRPPSREHRPSDHHLLE